MIRRIPLEGMPRDQWLEKRRSYINASEVGIVTGEASWGSPAVLFAEKKGLRPPQAENQMMQRGNLFEGAVFDALHQFRPEWAIERAKVWVIDDETRQACTPDGFAQAPDRDGIGIVQAKVISRSGFRDRWLDDPGGDIQFGDATPLPAYRMQTVFEMKLNGVSWGVLAVLIIGEFSYAFRLFDMERDPVLEDLMDYHVKEFFERYLDPGIMPAFEPARDAELVKALYPNDTGAAIDLTSDNRASALVDDLIETQAALKRLDAQEKEIKTELQSKMQDNSFALVSNGRCLSWRQQSRKGFAVAPATFRVLRLLNKIPKELTHV